jgi:hypothetical protein
VGRALAVRADFARSPQQVPILLGEVSEERHPYTGETILLRRDVATPTLMYEYGTFRATETEVAPAAYYVLPDAEDVIARLEAHGVTVVRQPTTRALPVERFVLDSTRVAAQEFQGRRERTVWGEWVPVMETLPAGTAHVALDQPLGRLAFTLLEPRSDDGFVAWGLVDRHIEEGAVPIFRVGAPGR